MRQQTVNGYLLLAAEGQCPRRLSRCERDAGPAVGRASL